MSKFKTHNGIRYTKALFLEESYEDKSNVIYTLKDEDHSGYKSLYLLYQNMKDPTEIKFAEAYFDGWEHWQMICNTTWFKPYIERWREELDLHIKAEALANIFAAAQDSSNKFNYEANKFILSGQWKTKAEKNAVGRPSKEAIKREAENLFVLREQTEDDYKRILS